MKCISVEMYLLKTSEWIFMVTVFTVNSQITMCGAYLIVFPDLYIFQGETSENKSKRGRTINSFTLNFS